jgi:hypothetical protein
VQCICGWCFATIKESKPAEPPMSTKYFNHLKF